jgi:2-haloacid dehalogenase
MNNKPKLLIFDVNETLLDMSPLKNSINERLKNSQAFDVWFPTLLQYSLVETITDNYKDFSDIAAATLKMTGLKYSVELSEKEIKETISPITKLSPHAEVKEALKLLKENDFLLVALTNGKPEVANEQIKFAGLESFFDKVLSVEHVKKYKPHPDTYSYACASVNVIKENAMLIAAHGWDITGAHRAGLQTGFIDRPGKFHYPNAKDPDVQGDDLLSIAKVLLRW